MFGNSVRAVRRCSFCSSYCVSGAVRLQWSHPTERRTVRNSADRRSNRPDRAGPRLRRPDSHNGRHGQGYKIFSDMQPVPRRGGRQVDTSLQAGRAGHEKREGNARRRPGVQIGGPTRPHGVMGSWGSAVWRTCVSPPQLWKRRGLSFLF